MAANEPAPSRKDAFRRYRRALSGVCVFAVAMTAGYTGFRWWDYRSDMTCVEKWARIAPAPESAERVKLGGEPGFNRTLTLQFLATPEVLEDWIRRSPGVLEAEPVEDPRPGNGEPGVRAVQIALKSRVAHYRIHAGGRAAFAEITFRRIDDNRLQVFVRTYRS